MISRSALSSEEYRERLGTVCQTGLRLEIRRSSIRWFYGEVFQQIREEEKSLHSSQGFSQALPSSDTKWNVSLVRNISVLHQEPGGSEHLGVVPVLLVHVDGVGGGGDDVPGRTVFDKSFSLQKCFGNVWRAGNPKMDRADGALKYCHQSSVAPACDMHMHLHVQKLKLVSYIIWIFWVPRIFRRCYLYSTRRLRNTS